MTAWSFYIFQEQIRHEAEGCAAVRGAGRDGRHQGRGPAHQEGKGGGASEDPLWPERGGPGGRRRGDRGDGRRESGAHCQVQYNHQSCDNL